MFNWGFLVIQWLLTMAFSILVEGVTYIGSFKNHLHDVTGDIYTIDGIDNQIQIRRFTYDGAGKDTFFWAGNEGKEPNSEKGFVLEYPYKGRSYFYAKPDIPNLPEFEGNEQPIVLTLPDGRKAKDLKWLSVWDRTWSSSYGDMIWPKNDMIKTIVDLFA